MAYLNKLCTLGTPSGNDAEKSIVKYCCCHVINSSPFIHLEITTSVNNNNNEEKLLPYTL